MTSLRFPILALALVLPVSLGAACGGKVFVDTTAGVGGNGGNGGAGGGAGGDTTTGQTTSTGSAPYCGGKQGFPCPAGQWCSWNDVGTCGGFDGTGTCEAFPQGCPPDCPGVCGCDGNFYCNACLAHAAGTDTSNGFNCYPDAGTGGDQYSAYMMATNVVRYVIFKAEPSVDRCLRMIVSMIPGGQYPNIQVTMGWGVEMVEITPHASDCALGPGGYPIMTMQSYKASDAAGDLKQDDTQFPHVVTVHVKASFPNAAPWVPPGDNFDVDNLPIFGGGLGGP